MWAKLRLFLEVRSSSRCQPLRGQYSNTDIQFMRNLEFHGLLILGSEKVGLKTPLRILFFLHLCLSDSVCINSSHLLTRQFCSFSLKVPSFLNLFQIIAFGETLFAMRQFLPLAEVRDVHYELLEWRCCGEDNHWRVLDTSSSSLVEIVIPAIRFLYLYCVTLFHCLPLLVSLFNTLTRVL